MADSTATHTDQPFPITDARLAEAFALVESDEIAVLSLDVFDTVLWRKVAEPRWRVEHAQILSLRDIPASGGWA